MGNFVNAPNCELQRGLRIDQVFSVYRDIGRALIKSGKTPLASAELLETRFVFTCCECGIRINGKELAVGAVSSDHPGNYTPKIARLLAGYCARKGCQSHYCDLHLEATPEVDWDW